MSKFTGTISFVFQLNGSKTIKEWQKLLEEEACCIESAQTFASPLNDVFSHTKVFITTEFK